MLPVSMVYRTFWQVLLIGLPYKFLCWERAESSSQSTESLPFLVLQFPVAALEKQYSTTIEAGDTSLFQIFSKQARIYFDKWFIQSL